jgi:hypothetical protein
MFGQVLRRACGLASAFRTGDFRQAEIQNLGRLAGGNENVSWLDVTMDDAFGVSTIKRISDFDGQRQQRFLRHGATVDAMFQRDAFQKFHGDERMPVLFADVVDGADIGMIQRGGGLGLALKTCQRARIARNFRREKLEGHEAVQPRVLGLINHAHSATAELLQNAIVGDSLADERVGR